VGWVSALDDYGRTVWIVDAHRDEKRFVVRADEKLTAFSELEAAIRSSGKDQGPLLCRYRQNMPKNKVPLAKTEAGRPNNEPNVFTPLGIAVFGIERNNSLHNRFWFNNKPVATTLVLGLPFETWHGC